MTNSVTSDLCGSGYGDSHVWQVGATRQLGSVQNELRGTRYSCRKCRVSFFYHYNMFSNVFDAIKDACIDEHCSENPNFVAPTRRRIEQLKKELEISTKPVENGEYDPLETQRPRLVREIRIELDELSRKLFDLEKK